MSAFSAETLRSSRQLRYRITGPQSIERLESLLHGLGGGSSSGDSSGSASDNNVVWVASNEDAGLPLDFVWETTCERSWKDAHSHAKVLNRLHNSTVLEDKSNLAFLELKSPYPHCLDTFVASSAAAFAAWASARWTTSPQEVNVGAPEDVSGTADWWAVKASKGNGGKDVWIVNRSNVSAVLAELPREGELVVQRYVQKPLLWRNKKFHLRCYGLVFADMTAMLYEKCFVLTAGQEYRTDVTDASCHITNLSVNKRFAGHPGQVPCDFPAEYPHAFPSACDLWAGVCGAAAEYMTEQSSPNNFEFCGLDIIIDSSNNCWLVEINRLPGLESSSNNKEEEDDFYNEMMRDVLSMVLRPLLCADSDVPTASSRSATGRWRTVRGPHAGSNTASTETHKNLFRWKLFTRKNRSKLVIG